MKLEHPYVGRLIRAIRASFNTAGLQTLMLEYFGINPDLAFNEQNEFVAQVNDLHAYFDRQYTTELLVAALRDARPRVPEFTAIADHLGFMTLPPEGLEAIVRRSSKPLQDVELFRLEIGRLERAVCRVEGGLAGTGTLISPKHVLTNRHVVAGCIDQTNAITGPITCTFDKKASAEGVTAAAPVRVARVLASSPHAAADEQPGSFAEAPAALDYALLELDGPAGEEPIVPGGAERGWVCAKASANPTSVNAGLLILQHPAELPMKIDLGAMMSIGATRMRHSVNTMKGSSGSPIFNAELELVAIHHAGHVDWPAANLGYNQGIPLAAILQDLAAKSIALP